MKPWLTYTEAAYVYKIPRSTLRDWARTGKIRTRKVMLSEHKYRIEYANIDLGKHAPDTP